MLMALLFLMLLIGMATIELIRMLSTTIPQLPKLPWIFGVNINSQMIKSF